MYHHEIYVTKVTSLVILIQIYFDRAINIKIQANCNLLCTVRKKYNYFTGAEPSKVCQKYAICR